MDNGSLSRMALLPTAWGLCGVRWRILAPANGGFDARPATGLLTRIITPGLAQAQLRHALRAGDAEIGEILPDARGRFHAHLVPEWFSELAAYLQGYFASSLSSVAQRMQADCWPIWKDRLDTSLLTPFQLSVLTMVAQLPRGQTLTYGDVARRLGKPQACRAVGAALGANPWPILIPCHRVIGASGRLTGFTAPGGISAKRRMLHLESVAEF